MSERKTLETASDTSMFRCPRCGASIKADASNQSFRCTNSDCVYSARKAFPVAYGKPVLIDFERSIISEESFANIPPTPCNQESLHDRRELPWPVQLLYRVLAGNNVETATHAVSFQSMVKAVSPQATVLVVGGGTIGNGMNVLYDDPALRLWSFDVYPSSKVDFVAYGHAIPLPDGCVDGVWVQAVLEHVLNPDIVVAEIHRVLRPNSVVYAETAFLQPVHEGPYDFIRFTESGHRWLFRWFEKIDAGPVCGPGSSLFMILRYVFSGIFRHRRLGTALACLLFFWVRFFDLIIPGNFSIDAAFGTYFLGRKVQQPLDPHAMVAYYSGARTLI